MRQLPDAGTAENDELDKHPSNDACVGRFGLISELGFAFLFVTVSHSPSTSMIPKKEKGEREIARKLFHLHAGKSARDECHPGGY